MVRYTVEYTTAAIRNIDEIAEYHLDRVGPKSAEKITHKLLHSIQRLEEFPLSGPIHHDPFLAERGYRKLICGKYVAVYKRINDAIYIYGIFHGSLNYTKLLE